MIVKKKIELVIEVEETCVEYIIPSIEDGMEFNENEGIIEYTIDDWEESLELSEKQKDKRFHAASLILAQLVKEQPLFDYTALARKSLKLATILLKEE